MTTSHFPPAVRETGEPLTDRDYMDLDRRWINREIADMAGIRRANSALGATLMGRQDHADYGGLLIPFTSPGESRVREWRLRRDRPDIEYKDNRPREVRKYLSPPGRGNMVYFVPGTSTASLEQTEISVVVTEGEFKTLALWRLANFEVAITRFIPVGLGGVWNWRGTVGKTTGPDGDRRDVKGVIPDLDLVRWEGRRVIIAFDADAGENEQVEIARNQLMRVLRMRGAAVGVARWEMTEGKGIDDLLARIGPQTVLRLLAGVNFEEEASNLAIYCAELAERITSKFRFARDVGGDLHVFRDGRYHPNGATVVRQQVKHLFERMRMTSKWTSHRAEEVVRYIDIDAPILLDRPDTNILNVQNGLLDLTTRTLLPHSPELLSQVQLPVRYDPKARCPMWEKFVTEVFPHDAGALAWEVLAWSMTPDTSIQKAVLLTGEGSNGKSTFLQAAQAFLGRQNVTAISLQKLEKDRFSTARLVGKLANICPDLPSEELSNTSIFKAITGGDVVLAERKFQQSFEFVPFVHLIFSANLPPRTRDASQAFFRRWVVIPFERVFDDDGPDTIAREKLDALLSTPSELSGALNHALEVLPSIKSRGFTETSSMRRALDEFRQVTDPVAVWLDQNTFAGPEALIPAEMLLSKYNSDCAANNRPFISKKALGAAIAKLRPNVKCLQRTVNREITWCYVGLGSIDDRRRG